MREEGGLGQLSFFDLGRGLQGFPRVKKQGVANYFDLPPLKGWQIGMAGQK